MMLRDNWTTFVKARLNCSLPGEYPFYLDEIQGVTFSPDNGMVYATFTTPKYVSRNSRTRNNVIIIIIIIQKKANRE